MIFDVVSPWDVDGTHMIRKLSSIGYHPEYITDSKRQWAMMQKWKVQHINNIIHILYGITPNSIIHKNWDDNDKETKWQRDHLLDSSWFPPIPIGGTIFRLEKHGLWMGVRCSDCGWSHYAASKGKHAWYSKLKMEKNLSFGISLWYVVILEERDDVFPKPRIPENLCGLEIVEPHKISHG